ncbi:MAG TPA: hypothetical protein VK489_00310 [Ferruginibacter sp.]|nr:hypothetical protein [Ferruginibacter sp.]
MLQRLVLIAILAFATAFITSKIIFVAAPSNTARAINIEEYKKKSIIRCGPDWESLKAWLEETDIPAIPGAGNYKWAISTKNDSAQFYFNQGINMYYSFHIIESMASFKKAAKFDPECAMLYWAQALAYGPNINDLGYAASPAALQATQMARSLSGKAGKMEKALINAISVRYTADSADATRAKLNAEYTTMMKAVYERFPGNADAQALYADAMMLEHPWDLWHVNGTAKAWTPLIRAVLEKLLLKNPGHPGANHYYIHVMEPSPYANKALPSADRLGKLTPGLSHTVHMPSHIYLRTGQYQKGVTVNENAANSYKNIIPLYSPVTGNDFLYIIHNLHMQTNNAMMAGLSEYSTRTALETAQSISADYLAFPAPLGSYVQYLHMTPTLVNVRFGKWDDLLTAKQPDQKQVYANILWHFGRGMAFAGQSKLTDAGNELKNMQELMKDSSLYIPFPPFSPAIDGAVVAEKLLAGSIALAEKKYSNAIAAFTKAVSTEENMVYNEPRDWLLNPKHYLGNAYLQAGRPLDAENIFRKDLLNNNENGWALFGTYQALLPQKKNTEAAKMMSRFNKAFTGSDIKIKGAVFDHSP